MLPPAPSGGGLCVIRQSEQSLCGRCAHDRAAALRYSALCLRGVWLRLAVGGVSVLKSVFGWAHYVENVPPEEYKYYVLVSEVAVILWRLDLLMKHGYAWDRVEANDLESYVRGSYSRAWSSQDSVPAVGTLAFGVLHLVKLLVWLRTRLLGQGGLRDQMRVRDQARQVVVLPSTIPQLRSSFLSL